MPSITTKSAGILCVWSS